MVSRINEKISALKQEPESGRGLALTVMELFRVMRESCAQIVKRRAAYFSGHGAKHNIATSPRACVWQNRDTFIHPINPCVRVVTWAVWQTLTRLEDFMEDPAGYYFY